MPDWTEPHGNFRLSDEAERPAPRVLGGGAHVSVWARTDAGGELVEKRALDADGLAALRAEMATKADLAEMATQADLAALADAHRQLDGGGLRQAGLGGCDELGRDLLTEELEARAERGHCDLAKEPQLVDAFHH
jgi:hypothetical protein